MSHEIVLKPRTGRLSASEFLDYFSAHDLYSVDADQAWYQNEDTEVYFSFEVNDGDESAPFVFTMNYFRPTFFVREAERELTAVVKEFGMMIEDPQAAEPKTVEYDPAAFVTSWLENNAAATAALLSKTGSDIVGDTQNLVLPKTELERIWEWNYGRNELQDRLGETVFVPKIMMMRINERLCSVCVWADAIPAVIPPVDVLFFTRDNLAPRKWLRKVSDFAIAKWDDFQPLLKSNATEMIGDAFKLAYFEIPADLKKLVQRLSSFDITNAERISLDQILDSELMQNAK